MSDKPTLFSMIQESSLLEQKLIESGGELTPEIEQSLVNIDLSIAAKVDATELMLERIDMAASYWAGKADEASRVSKALSNAHDRLRAHVKRVMVESGRDEILGEDFRFKLSKAKARLIVDPLKLDASYCKEKVTIVPDNERIRGELELGIPVEGASLEPAFSLRTYPQKKI